MKRVKLMLAAIVMLVTVSGSLAFKAKDYGLIKFYTTVPSGTVCNVETLLTSNTPDGFFQLKLILQSLAMLNFA
ncbi:hypothetical protein [Paraflavitalea speifideaquila]|uniref:hypothetical protein n=1 Tax=Paraflavitalea speifideaquila TaxID=3076558 RepID=UPI0028E8A859|nr:hypothetical protein [Paraflavitalea speifideiaquila]